MTKVIHLAQARAAIAVQAPAPSHSSPGLDTIQHQAHIENALSMALFHVRSDAPSGLHAATAKANRALSLLKQSCAVRASAIQGE